MKRIIRFLWTGVWAVAKPCAHEWEVLRWYEVEFMGRGQPRQYDMKCKKCGDIKRIK